eukprot:CAMPEP_0185744258 /NCGR_PEP_ID=MMETSP1174-20130828/2285_1 /TAXON_ID=35687 /ORGANISM="Dictyocha speculum, Strain CCMP1381" /LENGTH=85 /DNA_ID=CAMNT_0028417519 /DNA_START=215 /DNA_END=472 /DNA_ORIENTATION=+
MIDPKIHPLHTAALPSMKDAALRTQSRRRQFFNDWLRSGMSVMIIMIWANHRTAARKRRRLGSKARRQLEERKEVLRPRHAYTCE